MTVQQVAINAASDARLIANAIASGPTEAMLIAAEEAVLRLSASLPALRRALKARREVARETERRRRRDLRIVKRDAIRLAKRKAAEQQGADFSFPAMTGVGV